MDFKFTTEEITAERERQNYEIWQKCPVGTVIWHMTGRVVNDDNGKQKMLWYPKPECIQQSNERGFLTIATLSPTNYGSSWSNIGRNYFLSREECLEEWGDRPTADDYELPENEAPKEKIFGKVVSEDTVITIWDGNIATHIYQDIPFQLIDGKNIDKTVLTLKEIRSRFPKGIITVFTESGLSGVAYQIGNAYEPNGEKWRFYARTGGYA